MGRKKKFRASTTEEDEIEMDNAGRSSEKSLYEVYRMYFPDRCSFSRVIRVFLDLSLFSGFGIRFWFINDSRNYFHNFTR